SRASPSVPAPIPVPRNSLSHHSFLKSPTKFTGQPPPHLFHGLSKILPSSSTHSSQNLHSLSAYISTAFSLQHAGANNDCTNDALRSADCHSDRRDRLDRQPFSGPGASRSGLCRASRRA